MRVRAPKTLTVERGPSLVVAIRNRRRYAELSLLAAPKWKQNAQVSTA